MQLSSPLLWCFDWIISWYSSWCLPASYTPAAFETLSRRNIPFRSPLYSTSILSSGWTPGMTTCSGYHFVQSSEGLKLWPTFGAGKSSRGFPCADLYSSFSRRIWQEPQTLDCSAFDFPVKFQISFFDRLFTCFAPGPWQFSHPTLSSLQATFWAFGLAGSYWRTRYPVVWQVAHIVSQSFFWP